MNFLEVQGINSTGGHLAFVFCVFVIFREFFAPKHTSRKPSGYVENYWFSNLSEFVSINLKRNSVFHENCSEIKASSNQSEIILKLTLRYLLLSQVFIPFLTSEERSYERFLSSYSYSCQFETSFRLKDLR